MTVPDVNEAIPDGGIYQVTSRGTSGFVYRVMALNHPHEASGVYISDKNKCVRWMLACLRSTKTVLEDGSISNKSEVEKQTADLQTAAEIILRHEDLQNPKMFYTGDVGTASVVARALLACGKSDVQRVP